jgi:hypothetical protein
VSKEKLWSLGVNHSFPMKWKMMGNMLFMSASMAMSLVFLTDLVS